MEEIIDMLLSENKETYKLGLLLASGYPDKNEIRDWFMEMPMNKGVTYDVLEGLIIINVLSIDNVHQRIRDEENYFIGFRY